MESGKDSGEKKIYFEFNLPLVYLVKSACIWGNHLT